MPYASKAQQRACHAKKAAGTAGSWDCDEWDKATKGKELPEKVKPKKKKATKK